MKKNLSLTIHLNISHWHLFRTFYYAVMLLTWDRKFKVLEAEKGFDSALSPKIKLSKEYQYLEVITESTVD